MANQQFNLLTELRTVAGSLNQKQMSAFRRALAQTIPPAIHQAAELARLANQPTGASDDAKKPDQKS